ncbi:hypothetical protein JTE90_014896 [Oedothorax gibbosus]|uniref:Uncharacterized protein n=1 Tax=Oedothorax gibbosus TaxID=931172 RepID=A0AAV6VLP9_9ARAC|nr:hypothetical protein JTE90_014896 [Oedothorax gibbosus]
MQYFLNILCPPPYPQSCQKKIPDTTSEISKTVTKNNNVITPLFPCLPVKMPCSHSDIPSSLRDYRPVNLCAIYTGAVL